MKTRNKRKPLRLYVGKTHSRKQFYVATTANGSNIAGNQFLIIRFEHLSKSKLKDLARRFHYFADRAEKLANER